MPADFSPFAQAAAELPTLVGSRHCHDVEIEPLVGIILGQEPHLAQEPPGGAVVTARLEYPQAEVVELAAGRGFPLVGRLDHRRVRRRCIAAQADQRACPDRETDPRHIPSRKSSSDRCKPYGGADVTTHAAKVVPSFLQMPAEFRLMHCDSENIG